jgi:oligopeptide transport system substrate-binding protein
LEGEENAMKSKTFSLLGLLVVASMILVACAPTEVVKTIVVTEIIEGEVVEKVITATPEPVEEVMEPATVYYNWATEPPTADPAMTTDTTSSALIGSIFTGLVDQNLQSLESIPSLATSWAPNADSTVWTFNLRTDVPWVQYNPSTGETAQVLDGDGNPRFTNANDVVYGVKRTCDPRTASDYAWLLYVIKGCADLNGADPDAEDFQEVYDAMGVVALDDATVEFTLEYGAGFFPQVTTMANLYPTPQWTIEERGDRWIEPGFIVTNGAYVMTEWVHGDHLILEKNELWPIWGTGVATGNVERLIGYTIEEASTGFAMYENDELDTASVPLDQIDRVKADSVLSAELYNVPVNCTYYYGFVTTKDPVDDPNVRRALSMGVDRPTLATDVLKGGQIPANTFTNPLNFGSAAEDPDIAPWALTEEKGGTGYAAAVELGKGLLADAGFPNGAGLEILLMHNVSEGHARIAQAIQAMWQEAYPEMTVTVETQEWRVYLETLQYTSAVEDVPHVFRMGWCGDYPHANNWMHEVFNPEEGANRLRFEMDDPISGDLIAEYTATTKAAQTADEAKAVGLYKRAEKLLNDEIAGIIPIYYYTAVNVTKPYLHRTFDPIKLHLFEWTLE